MPEGMSHDEARRSRCCVSAKRRCDSLGRRAAELERPWRRPINRPEASKPVARRQRSYGTT